MSKRGSKRKQSAPSQGSPNKRRKLAEGLLQDPTSYSTEFQQGQIVKIDLVNWVTFDKAVIDCEPGLNLIVGPNGTGKSSIVCAICLGLGGKPRSLGRGEKASDFIKYGRSNAVIKIELFNENRSNDMITRIITKTGSKWSLNGKAVPNHKIDSFVKDKRNIKVDNLCQFLAQDRVSEFARLTPKELLIETEKAIEDDQLYKWHQFLIDEGEKASNSQNEIENLRQVLRQDENELESLKRTIEQFASKKKMEEEMRNYQALHEWTKADNKHKEYKLQLKESRKLQRKYDKKKGDIGPLRDEKEKWTKQARTAEGKVKKSITELKRADRRRMTATKKMEHQGQEIKDYEDEIRQAREDQKTKSKRIKKITAEKHKLQQQIETFDFEEIERAKQEKQLITKNQLREARKERNNIDQQIQRATSKKHNIERNLHQINNALDAMTNETRRKEKHIFGNNRQREKQFKAWVDQHRHEFRGEVFGPIVSEMTVKNDLHAKFLNALINASVFYGYVCTHGDDWQTLLRQASKYGLTISIYTSASQDNSSQYGSQQEIRRPVRKEQLADHGVDGYLDEIFEAPEIIKRTLNDNLGLSQRAYCMKDPQNYQLDKVLVTVSGQHGRLRSLVTPSAVYTIKDSRYSQNVMRVMGNLIEHRNPILIKTPDYSQQIAVETQRKDDHMHQLDNIEAEMKVIIQKKKDAVAAVQRLSDKKKELETKISQYQSIQNKFAKKSKDLAELMNENGDNDFKEIEKRLTENIQRKNKERIDTLEHVAVQFEQIHNLMKEANAHQICKKHFDEERKHVEQKIKMINHRNADLRKAYDASKRKQDNLKSEYDALIRNANQRFPRNRYVKTWTDDDKKLDLEEIMDKINHLQGRINVLFIDEERVNRYHRLQKKIDSQSKKLSRLENDHANKADEIKSIENQWKPQLTEAVDKISSKFGEFFNQFNNAQGKIELVSSSTNADNNVQELKYSEWCIDILTKFRNDQPWKRLTSSSQSGGEKSVSTMLYLLSLQEVTTVPFRVVDEINQGMDPINERRIMQILNFECTPKQIHVRRLPQYFVVTPKLLPRLQYSPCSSVYVIFNGPFQMPQDYWQLNSFINTQKEHNTNNEEEEEEDDDDEEEEDEE